MMSGVHGPCEASVPGTTVMPSTTSSVPNQRAHGVRPRALAEIGYNSIANSEIGNSSEDDTPETRALKPVDVEHLVGVSLGRAQTRLTSPTTPYEEKAAAIEDVGGFFDGPPVPDNVELDEESDENTTTAKSKEKLNRSRDGANDTPDFTESEPEPDRPARRPARSQTEAAVRLPSPWRAGSKPPQAERGSHRAALREGIRRRSSSGPGGHTWSHAIMSSLPSLPKHFTLNSPFSFGHNDDHKNEGQTKPKRSGSLFASFTSSSSSTSKQGRNSVPELQRRTSPEAMSANEMNARAVQSSNLERLPTRQLSRVISSPYSLRRSNSDNSLQTFRSGGTALSRAPSLGDDSRFEHVQAQVNSRVKAIKDSLQDSNIKLPSMPSMPNLPSLSYLSLGTVIEKRPGSGTSNFSPASHSLRNLSGSQNALQKVAPKVARPQSARPSTRGAGQTSKSAHPHPNFEKAVANLTGDVVILGGYRGSILRSAEPPHRQLWVPIKVGLNIRKVDLEVGLEAEDDERAEEKIIPSGMLTHIGPVDISRRLFKRLRASDNAKEGHLRVHDYGYDWRLDPQFLSKRLVAFLETLPCNQPGTPKDKRGATVIAHSLGGLITRHAVNQRPDLFAGVVYAGVPTTCVNILGPFRNGDDVLLSSRVLTAQVNFTIRTSFALLPLNGRCFFNRKTKEEYPVDFFDPQTWIDGRLSPCIARPLPPLSQPQPTGFAGIMNTMANALPTRKGSLSTRSKQATQHAGEHATGGLSKLGGMDMSDGGGDIAVARNNIDRQGTDNLTSSKRNVSQSKSSETAAEEQSTSIATAVTIPREAAIKYLTRVLASVKEFKQNLDYKPAHGEKNMYPPAAVIYGKTTPTVYGARVVSREGIKHADAYDDLAFASGDGVVLARAAMLPEGYQAAKGGIVCSERGHVTLLGDLEAVGKCLRSIQVARKKGVGKG